MEKNKVFIERKVGIIKMMTKRMLPVMLVGVFTGMIITFLIPDEYNIKEPQKSTISIIINGKAIEIKDVNFDNKKIDNNNNRNDERKLINGKIDPEQTRRSKLIYVYDEPDHIVEYGRDPISGIPDFVDNADISDFI